jgi:hypothetical protein
MNDFVVAAESSAGNQLALKVRALRGKALTSTAWIVPWDGTADSLRLKLQPYSDSRLIVFSTSADWSYSLRAGAPIHGLAFTVRNRI